MPVRHVSRVRALYRRILLLHRVLPPDLKALGDQYVKDEFRRHKTVGSDEAERFLQEWEASNCPLFFAPDLWGPSAVSRFVSGRGRLTRLVSPGLTSSNTAAACSVWIKQRKAVQTILPKVTSQAGLFIPQVPRWSTSRYNSVSSSVQVLPGAGGVRMEVTKLNKSPSSA